MTTHTIHGPSIPGHRALFEHAARKDVWSVRALDPVFLHGLTVYFDRAQATALHAWLTEELGLTGTGRGPVRSPATLHNRRPISPELASARLSTEGT